MEKGTLELYDSGGVIVLDEGVDEVIPPPVEAAPPPPTETNDDRLGQCFSPEARSSTTEINIVDLDMISCIGRGGFSHVWKAIRKTPQGEEIVAVKKLILTVDERTERVREALLAEAKVNAGLMHKNIVMFKGVSCSHRIFANLCHSQRSGVAGMHRSSRFRNCDGVRK